MGAYVLLCQPDDPVARPPEAAKIAAILERSSWRPIAKAGGVTLFTLIARPIPWRRFGCGLIIGEVFDVPEFGAGTEATRASGALLAERLLQGSFGRYVFVTPAEGPHPTTVLRDPSGGLGCVTWRWGGVDLVADQLHPELIRVCGSAFAINWSAVSDYVADASTLLTHSGLDGVRPLAPGSMRRLDRPGEDQTLWRPATLARQPFQSTQTAGAAITAAVDRAINALATGSAPILAEVSGGLDSSIVAARLCASGADVRTWLNIATADARGDERLYARALCDHLGVPLTLKLQPDLVLTPEDIALSQTGVCPSLNGMDRDFEEQVIAVASEHGARRVFTGLGGDSVFFAFPTALIVRDAVLRRGPRVLFTPLLEQIARWTRTSTWELAWSGLSGGRRGGYAVPQSAWIVRPSAHHRHPWLEGADGLPPGKRFQIESIAHTQAALGPCRRSNVLDLVHPLMSQPVLEACLRTPIDLLVSGGRDRGLARQAFGPCLPPIITERRSKGDVALRFGTALVEGLPAIRSYLLEGRLAAAGVIESSLLDATLDEASLPHGNEALNILRAVAVEGWVRHWEGALAAAAVGFSDRARGA